MSYPFAVALLAAMILAVIIWAGSLFFDYNLARQLLLAFIIPSVIYLGVSFKENVLDDV